MKQQVEQIIAQVAAKHSDRRLHVFKVQLDRVEEKSVTLAGKVLEPSNLQMLRQEFLRALPAVALNDSAIQILRKSKSVIRTVAVNLTDLHVEPSFLSELLTQVTNGMELELLEEQEKWCFVRQTDGYMGWAYKPYLCDSPASQPTHLVVASTANIYPEPQESPEPLTRVLAGSRVRASKLQDDWARIEPVGQMMPLPCAWRMLESSTK